MKFQDEEYYQASVERIGQARRLYDTKSDYAMSIYCSGLSVECMFRAFRWAHDTEFHGRHELQELLKASRLLRIDDEHMRRRNYTEDQIRDARVRFNSAFSEVLILWHNNLRFASEAYLKQFLGKIGRLAKVKGDPLKKNALDLLRASETIVDRGVSLWISRTK